ncbi:MAG: putative MarR family transcriptional regulator [Friedmanniella sp.]|nr:putative MarR family transcriptional regulator [Friedmanniella sp.]
MQTVRDLERNLGGDTADRSDPHSPAVDSVLDALMSIGRLMRHRVQGDHLDPGTFWLLKTLLGSGSLRVTELAGCANLDTSTVSRHVTQLDRAGLIHRTPDPQDGRAQRVELSEHGRAELQSALTQRRALLTRSLEGWDDADVEQLDVLLARFVGNIESLTAELEQA